jgi:uncharacterized GH25 family protein
VIGLRALACGAIALAAVASAHAHDSWFVQDDGARPAIVTGTRYPRADLVAPPESIARQQCSAAACWAELHEFEIDLDPKIVEVYFRDALPSKEVRERWKALRAKGVTWHERYRKFARIQFASDGAKPAGLDLEIVPAGKPGRFMLLSNRQPVPGQPVELVSERSPLGLWSRTNAQGEVEWQLPFAGQWLVRTIIIEPDGDTAWKSRFATLVFDAR